MFKSEKVNKGELDQLAEDNNVVADKADEEGIDNTGGEVIVISDDESEDDDFGK